MTLLMVLQVAPSTSISSACVFERLPVVMPDFPEWELDYLQWQHEFRLRTGFYKSLPKELTDQKAGPEETEEGGLREGGGGWEPSSLTTAADRSGDRRTTNRRLDQRLFLLLRSKQSKRWEFPWVSLQEGESTRAGAERALKTALGTNHDSIQPYFVGNAPAAHFEQMSNDSEPKSAKLFFHRCQLIRGTIEVAAESPWNDYAWVAKDEITEFIPEKGLQDLLQKLL